MEHCHGLQRLHWNVVKFCVAYCKDEQLVHFQENKFSQCFEIKMRLWFIHREVQQTCECLKPFNPSDQFLTNVVCMLYNALCISIATNQN